MGSVGSDRHRLHAEEGYVDWSVTAVEYRRKKQTDALSQAHGPQY